MSIRRYCSKLIVPALLAVATVGVLWLTNRAVTPRESTWEDVNREAKSGGYRLITTGELRQFYEKNREKVLLVDTRQEWEFETGHIKGATNFPMEPTWWSRWRKQADLAATLGPDKDRIVIFY